MGKKYNHRLSQRTKCTGCTKQLEAHRKAKQWYNTIDDNVASDILENPDKKEQLKLEIYNRIQEEIRSYNHSPLVAPDQEVKVRPLYQAVWRIAAAVALVATLSLLVYQYKWMQTEEPEWVTYQTGPAQFKKITLPDSSIVYLHANSMLRAPKSFAAKVRELNLVYGQSFFEVKKNPQKPFVVHSHEIETRVLGTSFNIKAYQQEGYIAVTVNTGKVAVGEYENNSLITLDKLVPGEELIFDRPSKTFLKQKVDASANIAWKDGVLVLQDATYHDVKTQIENWYGMPVELIGEQNDECLFTARFNKMQLAHTLESLQQINSFSYEIKDGKVWITMSNC
ncbi:FecR family protein [Pontibacter silvestris]|uniref:FecR family protein n=1 Tax=Pontibacter silvestris TaxID=2305183 RepID=A0ABW4X101_9BACT|nr:FecR family protein [Pontibacter silvestris]MCC9135500.1 FecR domain-containing protein [Pontibacter silvestris]